MTSWHGSWSIGRLRPGAPRSSGFAWRCRGRASSCPRRAARSRMLPPFRLGVGGPVAGGRQYVPWVDLEDVVAGILFCLGDETVSGPVNLTAPEPVTNRGLAKELGKVLRRPAVLPVPAFALRVLYGDMASVVTEGVRAVPRRLLELGYSFKRPDLGSSLRAATGAD